jgi:SAM-dependent methyltransferase
LSTYEKTRDAWREIWVENADFAQELKTLDYDRSQELLNNYIPYLTTDGIILEAGCGLGQVVYYLRQRGFNVIGCDYVPEAINVEIVNKLNLPLMVADVHQLPYAENSLQAYLSFGVVEHFENGPQAALKEAFRVLRPGGVLVLTVPHPNFVEAARNSLNRLIPGRLDRVGERAKYYETQFNYLEMSRQIASVGFKVEKSIPLSHSYTWYGVAPIFRGRGYYQTSALAELFGQISKRILPWMTCFNSLTLARKP